MGKDWLAIRTKTEVSKYDAVRNVIQGWPEQVLYKVYQPQISQIAARGAGVIREIIRTDHNTQKEEPGRIKSGDMLKGVHYRVRERKKGFSMFVGWTDGVPGYSIFQEHGTKNGVRAMNSLEASREQMLSDLKALAYKVQIQHASDSTAVNFFDDGEDF